LNQELPIEQAKTSKLYFDWQQLYQFDPGIRSLGFAGVTVLFRACLESYTFRTYPDSEALLASRLVLNTASKPQPSNFKIAMLKRVAWALGKRNYFLDW